MPFYLQLVAVFGFLNTLLQVNSGCADGLCNEFQLWKPSCSDGTSSFPSSAKSASTFTFRFLNKPHHFTGDAEIIKPCGTVVFQWINKAWNRIFPGQRSAEKSVSFLRKAWYFSTSSESSVLSFFKEEEACTRLAMLRGGWDLLKDNHLRYVRLNGLLLWNWKRIKLPLRWCYAWLDINGTVIQSIWRKCNL